MSACSVLVVDDDPSILTTVAEFLSLEGYPVETATNGREALEVVERARPSIVLLDMRMPVLDGWGFAEALQDRAISLPILVMTASHSTAQWAGEVHAAGYIAKPFDLIDLLDAVEQVCAGA